MKLGNLKKVAQSYLQQYEQKGSATYAAALQAIGGILILDGFIGIDNPLGEKKRPGIFGTLGGMLFAGVFMLVPHFFGSLTGINDMTGTATATVAEVGAPQTTQSSDGTSSTTCSMKASYTVDGKQYSSTSTSRSSGQCGLSVGQTVTINYNPNNPAAWAHDVASIKSVLGIFFWAGVVVLIASIVTFVIRLLSIIFGWKLLRKGRALAATLPSDTSFGTIVNEIRQDFTKTLFNFGGGMTGGILGQALMGSQQVAMAPQTFAAPQAPSVPQAQVVAQSPVFQQSQVVAQEPVAVPVQPAVPVAPVAPVAAAAPITPAPIQPLVPQQPVFNPAPQAVPVQQTQPPQQPQPPLQ
jgi:hypothetical protein